MPNRHPLSILSAYMTGNQVLPAFRLIQPASGITNVETGKPPRHGSRQPPSYYHATSASFYCVPGDRELTPWTAIPNRIPHTSSAHTVPQPRSGQPQ
ncbi:predicted protein [Plenodomus lingam JN3]|uniref:Predicted protein n=1 Tax=Leptosphaeria maculans (strain JN3 / isolate v23.1.3 / race Av1-4-5-6-7-8) TaxID=985895 RepID=E5A218_LEPMJ|nr:predicted protein [Plenodomus lingam JN3]CBX97735.1 predicted protein [Plenodomus lingam JN3]